MSRIHNPLTGRSTVIPFEGAAPQHKKSLLANILSRPAALVALGVLVVGVATGLAFALGSRSEAPVRNPSMVQTAEPGSDSQWWERQFCTGIKKSLFCN